MVKNYKELEKIIHYKFKNNQILAQCLKHKSCDSLNNNEKLEFLGDRVIGLILSKKLFDLYPDELEGDLDKRFAKLVNRKTCASIGWSIGISDFIILGDQNKQITKSDEKILCDACEAIIGAIFIDRGFNYVKEFVLRIWKKQIGQSYVTVLDSKTKLQEHSLKLYKKLPIYKFIGSKGPRHNPIFKISVSIYGSKNFLGIGNSKKEAEQNAANNLLKNINII